MATARPDFAQRNSQIGTRSPLTPRILKTDTPNANVANPPKVTPSLSRIRAREKTVHQIKISATVPSTIPAVVKLRC